MYVPAAVGEPVVTAPAMKLKICADAERESPAVVHTMLSFVEVPVALMRLQLAVTLVDSNVFMAAFETAAK